MGIDADCILLALVPLSVSASPKPGPCLVFMSRVDNTMTRLTMSQCRSMLIVAC